MKDGAPISARPLAPADLGLYAVTVFVWGTSWIALKAQLGEVSPEVSTLWRFLLAAPLMWLWALARGDTLAYPAADHRRFAAAGALMFSSNFVLFLYGGQYLPSGLLAVVLSLVSILNLLLGAAFLGQPIMPRVAVGGVIGAAGIALLYSPQIAGGVERGALLGLAFCLAGTLSFCAGNLVSTAIQRRGVPLLTATAWGMTYGVAALAAIVLVRGQPLIVAWTPRYSARRSISRCSPRSSPSPPTSRSCAASARRAPAMRRCCSRSWRSPSRRSSRATAGPLRRSSARRLRSPATCSCCGGRAR
jgi:drug/metabolite transporter (DMT)-like permease